MRIRGGLAAAVLSVLSGLILVVASPASAETGTSVTPSLVTGSGLGFDIASATRPSVERAWTASPYRSVNIYFSGQDRFDPTQTELTHDWVTTVLSNGWSIIPTVVDLQPPCWGGSGAKTSPATAASDGQNAAQKADQDLQALGLGGTIAYLDIENFDAAPGSSCDVAVQTFVTSFVNTLHGLPTPDKAGVYFNAHHGAPSIIALWGKSGQPDDVWVADWNGSATPDDSVLGAMWTDHRIHQYWSDDSKSSANPSGTPETYGGVKLSVDRNAIDGEVVSAVGVATPGGSPYGYDVNGSSAAGDQLNVRTQPNSASPIVTTLNAGQPISVLCQATGEIVNGDNIWDKLVDGTYVSDIFTTTAGRNTFSNAIPKCDTTRPTTSLTPLPAVTLASAVTIRWSATDGTDPNGEARGISSSQLRYRIANYTGGFGGWHYRSTTAFTNSLSLGAGHSYCVQARSFDLSGNASPWSNQSCLAKPLDDRSMARSSGWSLASRSHFYYGTVTSTTTKGRALARTHASLDRVGIVATTCGWCGSVRVYVGSHYVGTVNLHASSTHYRRLLMLPAFSRRSSTVKLVTNGKLVQIDGVVITRT